jgi:GAF domain-containing protein
MAKVASEAGTSLDPRIVEILQRRYVELEKLAKEQPLQTLPKLSTGIKVERGAAPDAGFAEPENPPPSTTSRGNECGGTIELANQAADALCTFTLQPGASLILEDLLSLIAVRTRRHVSCDALAVYVLRGGLLTAEFAIGDNFRLFSGLQIPLGEGLSGWVAQNVKPILNGNPSVEPGYLNDPGKYSTLRSALAVPLEGSSGVVAVLALYRVSADAFTREDLAILQALTSKAGPSIEEAVKRSTQPDVTARLSRAAAASK